jgi:hypothetical protein
MAGYWVMNSSGFIAWGGGYQPNLSMNAQMQDGRSPYSTLSLDSAEVRDLAFRRQPNSSVTIADDVWGKQYAPFNGYLSTPTFTTGVFGASAPGFPNAQIGSSSSNTPLTGTTYLRMCRHTATPGNYSIGNNKVVYIRVKQNSSGVTYRGDLQVFGIIQKSSTGATKFVSVPSTGYGTSDRWKTLGWQSSGTPTMASINTTVTTGSAPFLYKAQNAPSPSNGTGRIQNPFNTQAYGGNFWFESTSAPNNYYAHLKSPEFDIATGDVIDIYYGIDCPSLSECYIQIN